MLAGRRFRVELTDAQARLAQQTADACRAVWNTGLEQRREYCRRGAWISYEEQAHELVEAKKEHTWLAAAPSHCLQQTLRDLDEACRQRDLDGEIIRSATLTREGQHWFVSFLVDDGIATPAEHASPGTAVGVDRGVVVAVATSAGDLFDRAFTTPGEQRRALRLQRKLSRAAEGSANRNKTRQALGNIRARERRRRQEFCVKTARQLAQKNAVVVLEKLPVRSRTRRARPVADPAKPGQFLSNGGSAKSGLNRAILSKGWYRFEMALRSAARYSGTQVVKVPAALTSQRCSVCGHVDPKSRESQAVFPVHPLLVSRRARGCQRSQKHPGRRAGPRA